MLHENNQSRLEIVVFLTIFYAEIKQLEKGEEEERDNNNERHSSPTHGSSKEIDETTEKEL